MAKKMKVMFEDVQVADDDGTGWCLIEMIFRLGFECVSVSSDDNNCVL